MTCSIVFDRMIVLHVHLLGYFITHKTR